MRKITYPNGDCEYRILHNGISLLHREDGPAIEDVDGDKHWYVYGRCHRIDGPAIELTNSGCKQWLINGKLHRLDGPAIEYADGNKEWWINGICISSLKNIFLNIIGKKL